MYLLKSLVRPLRSWPSPGMMLSRGSSGGTMKPWGKYHEATRATLWWKIGELWGFENHAKQKIKAFDWNCFDRWKVHTKLPVGWGKKWVESYGTNSIRKSNVAMDHSPEDGFPVLCKAFSIATLPASSGSSSLLGTPHSLGEVCHVEVAEFTPQARSFFFFCRVAGWCSK